MIILQIILLMVIGLIASMIFQPLAKIIKIPAVLLFLIVGILFGPQGIFDIFSQFDQMSVVATYAIIVLFVASGIGLDIPAIKKSGKTSLILSSAPVLIEALIVTTVVTIVVMLIGDNIFNFANLGVVLLVFAMASPAIIIPRAMGAKGAGIKSTIFDEITVASIVDNFLPFPVLIILYQMAVILSKGETIKLGSLFIQIILIIIVFILAYLIGHLTGYIAAFLNKIESLKPVVISGLLVLFTILVVIISGPIGSAFGIIIGVGAGVGYNLKTKDSAKKALVGGLSTKLFGMFLLPIVFIYVGTQIQIELLLNLKIMIPMVLITVLAVLIKGYVARFYLARNGYSKLEQDFASYSFSAKGIILINLSLIIAPGFINNGMADVIQFMYLLAAVSIIITIPLSTIKLDSITKKMLN